MISQRDIRPDLAVALAGVLLGSASVLTWGETRPEVVDNQRVNQIDGPDPNDPVDDDDPNDQAHTKGQWETTVSLIRAANGSPLKMFAAWIDQS
jgi:hypothetical protein